MWIFQEKTKYNVIYIYIFSKEDGGSKGGEMLVVREFR